MATIAPGSVTSLRILLARPAIGFSPTPGLCDHTSIGQTGVAERIRHFRRPRHENQVSSSCVGLSPRRWRRCAEGPSTTTQGAAGSYAVAPHTGSGAP